MKIVLHDTLTALSDLLRRPVGERPAALRELYRPAQEAVSAIAEVDLAAMHTMGSGFRTDRDDDRYLPALDELREAGVWQRTARHLEQARDRLAAAAPDARRADTVHVVMVLGDPDDTVLMDRSAGCFGIGGFPGAIVLTIWPTPVSRRNAGWVAAHELHHNVRYANIAWDPATVTVGEQVAAEGLAEAFVRELGGQDALGPWSAALSGSELDRAYETIRGALGVTGMQHLAPYVHGDTTARLMGLEPVGLPDSAGYAVGLRIADRHLAASGLTAAASVALPAPTVLANAGLPAG